MNQRITGDGKKVMKLLYSYCVLNNLEEGDEFLFKPILSDEQTHIPLRINSGLEDIIKNEYIVLMDDEIWFTTEGWKLAVQLFS